ncbi:ABC-three component system protein [Paenibacillus sp. Soil724D2]|uniref:ABC-three component system protein n=1 Tax=Paenibacillus sp. (strain Soil724D2) TaxID=1736392 RepID=UPI0007131DC3|nr:ABC-three component system protein [Paenibacillus sp. Soil724D2]KRE48400.1 hypothetical protein ASG85_05195 [Paenibacillus sp. Soil724D2]
MNSDDSRQLTDEISDTHSAVPSWSGYDYQGKVAIYTVLSLINSIDINEISDYALEIEHLEDFSIKCNGDYHSIHQVKAYQSQNKSKISTYRSAILDLMGKSAKFNSVKYANLHSTCEIESIEKEELEKVLKEYEPTKKVHQQVHYKELLSEKEKFDEVFIKLRLNDDYEELPFKRIVNLDEIEEEVKDQIRKFYKSNDNHVDKEFSFIDENIDHIYQNLTAIIDDLVRSIHVKKTTVPEITFLRILTILKEEFIFKLSIKTAAAYLKLTLQEYFIDFCEDFGICPSDNEIQCIAWNNNWNYLKDLSDEEFLTICKKLSPNILSKNNSINIRTYRELINKIGVQKNLIPIINLESRFEIKSTSIKEAFVFNKDGVHHLITTIAESMGPNSVENIGKKIFQNLKSDDQLSYILFDIHKIITTEIEGAFSGNIFDVKKAYENEPDGIGVNSKEAITSPKRMDFLKIVSALEELK